MISQAVMDIIVGDVVEPEIVVNSSPSVGGLLDSLTGGIGLTGISSRAKPVAAPLVSSAATGTGPGSFAFDGARSASRMIDKEALRTFIIGSIPFGWYFYHDALMLCYLNAPTGSQRCFLCNSTLVICGFPCSRYTFGSQLR